MRASALACLASLLVVGTTACDDAVPPISGPRAGPKCTPARSAEPLPARPSAGVPSGENQPIYTEALFRDFRFHCGGCHVDNNLGDFNVTFATLSDGLTDELFDRVMSDDDEEYMPPPPVGRPWSERTQNPGDPVARLVTQLRGWLDAGAPNDFFFPAGVTGDLPTPTFRMAGTPAADLLTNIGSCIPDAEAIGTEPDSMSERDAYFADASELPKRLEETDLFTFDSALLARHGVVAFVPNYPLWSDGSGKLRHVRAPAGESIHYDPATREFVIPPNTRFYKTFFRRVVDSEGNEAFRKIETRIIVSRPDRQLPDGTFEPTALFGVYQWNDDETAAELIDEDDAPLRNGGAFLDKLLIYETDEVEAARVREETPGNAISALEEAGLIRRYAIPGSQRCIECHMGSVNGSFVLGFTPLQVHRRPLGEGGTFEPAGEDELTQLQRLIDYGVITGMTADDLLPLEGSQGDRRPRNDHELTAQGYMLGNCAHCHNPRGFPSVQNPELRDLLDFWPSASGGIFEFPLDRMSPRIKRGPGQNVPIPYITPSLFDLGGSSGDWLPKFVVYNIRRDAFFTQYIEAPWRSLIYRNVDTPFTYTDDFAIFPHMPMHTAGFDCRAPRILGDWMVSIPSRPIEPDGDWQYPATVYPQQAPQSYVEVRTGEAGYEEAVARAATRLDQYHEGERYDACPITSDVIDPQVARGGDLAPEDRGQAVPLPFGMGIDSLVWFDGIPERSHWVVTDLTDPPGDWNPRRATWYEYLVPRPLLPPPDPPPDECNTGTMSCPCEYLDETTLTPRLCELDAEEQEVVEILQTISITDDATGMIDPDLRSALLADVPLGRWQEKPGCDFASVPAVVDRTGPDSFRWIRRQLALGGGSRPVYELPVGEVVFGEICGNCHGRQADSRGRLASNIAALTGGDTRVANLRDGLFGPPGTPEDNRRRVFGDVEVFREGVDFGEPLDWSARYVLWMALGGTQRTIPSIFLRFVANAPVMGTNRPPRFEAGAASANMLTIAQLFCHDALPAKPETHDPTSGDVMYSGFEVTFETGLAGLSHGLFTSLIDQVDNGDAEVWERLCALGNPAPVRALNFRLDGFTMTPEITTNTTATIGPTWSLYDRAAYPAGAPVGTPNGEVVDGIAPSNPMPWCIRRPTRADWLVAAEQYVQDHAVNGRLLPFCPDELFATGANVFDRDEIRRWTLRGAMNAGLSVYMYLDSLAKGLLTPTAPYNECERLGP